RVPRAQPGRDVVDIRDTPEGGRDPDRREGRVAARQPPGRPLAADPVRGRRARRGCRRGRRLAGAPGLHRPAQPADPRRPRHRLTAVPRIVDSREVLAPREDVWMFLAEPYHLADWWPGIRGVQPDR